MNDCIFCKITKGEIPTNKIFENEEFLVILDINPLAPGHLQIIPKKHFRWVWEVPNIGKYFETVQKMAVALQKAFGVEMIEAKIEGEDVAHAHVWLFPSAKLTQGDKSDLARNAEKIRSAL